MRRLVSSLESLRSRAPRLVSLAACCLLLACSSSDPAPRDGSALDSGGQVDAPTADTGADGSFSDTAGDGAVSDAGGDGAGDLAESVDAGLFRCGPDTMCPRTQFCLTQMGGVAGSTPTYSCRSFMGDCIANPTCECLCPVTSPNDPGPGCRAVGAIGSTCHCGTSASVALTCAGS